MRREPEQKTVRERDYKPREERRREEPKKHEMPKAHHEAYMRGHRDGKSGKPANPGDPERRRGDGMKEAEGSRKDAGTEKGRPTVAKDPGRAKGDGMKIAARGENQRRSVVPNMREAERMVR